MSLVLDFDLMGFMYGVTVESEQSYLSSGSLRAVDVEGVVYFLGACESTYLPAAEAKLASKVSQSLLDKTLANIEYTKSETYKDVSMSLSVKNAVRTSSFTGDAGGELESCAIVQRAFSQCKPTTEPGYMSFMPFYKSAVPTKNHLILHTASVYSIPGDFFIQHMLVNVEVTDELHMLHNLELGQVYADVGFGERFNSDALVRGHNLNSTIVFREMTRIF